jgi:iron complex outermembrane recepter protein
MRISSGRALTGALIGAMCVATAAGATGPAPAAEETNGQLDTVVVSSRKIVENVQDVPIAIQAFDARKLEQDHLADIAGIARMTPSLNFQVGLLPSDTRPAIRGILAERGRPNVAILVDGVDATTDSAFVAGGGILANLRFVDVDRVEIVEGPQNVLYGRSAISGAIDYVTKRPGRNFEAEVSADGARFGTYELKGAMSAPLNDSTSVRLTAGHWSTDGWAHNPRTGGLLGDGSVTGTSLAVLFKPSETFSAFLRGQYSKEHYGPAPRTFASSVLPNGNTNTAVGGELLPVPGRPAN